MVSATGLWNQNANDYDQETLGAAAIDRDTTRRPASLDQPLHDLLPRISRNVALVRSNSLVSRVRRRRCSNLGSGCVCAESRLRLMVGTTGAMRAVIETDRLEIAPGLWCYRVDRKRFIIGGALSNGGDVFAWMKRTLALPKDLEAAARNGRARRSRPHGAAVFFGRAVAVLARRSARRHRGLDAVDRAVRHFPRRRSNRSRCDFVRFTACSPARFGTPSEIIATGGALLNSPAWTQMMADAIGRPLIACTEPEASCRGAAVWALEQIGAITSIGAAPASLGATFDPRAEYSSRLRSLLADQQMLFKKTL